MKGSGNNKQMSEGCLKNSLQRRILERRPWPQREQLIQRGVGCNVGRSSHQHRFRSVLHMLLVCVCGVSLIVGIVERSSRRLTLFFAVGVRLSQKCIPSLAQQTGSSSVTSESGASAGVGASSNEHAGSPSSSGAIGIVV